MAENPINLLMSTAMQSIKQMIDTNTVIGDPVTTPDGTVIIPVTKVSFGFGAGGGEYPGEKQQQQMSSNFGGGSGGGGTIEPIAFLVVCGGNIKLIPIKTTINPVEKILDLVPEMVDKVNGIIKEYTHKENEEELHEPKNMGSSGPDIKKPQQADAEIADELGECM